MNSPTCRSARFWVAAIAPIVCFCDSPAVASPKAYSQVLRFASEGRANVSKIRLATGRSARITVEAMSQSLSPNRAGTKYRIVAEDGSLPANQTEAIQRLMVIPLESRGKMNLRIETPDPAIRQSVTEAAAFLTGVVAARWLPKSEIRVLAIKSGETRAYAIGHGGSASIHLKPGVVNISTTIHELAHHIEGEHRWILELSKRFIARRARGGSPERLRDLTGQNYESHEVALRANWTTRGGHHYTGKFYGPSLKDAIATEAISMGLERLYSEPDTFFREDADYFLFLLLALQAAHK